MNMNDIKAGDKVTHWSEPNKPGTVIEVEPDKHSSDDPIYHVVWTEGGPAIPYRRYHHLVKIHKFAPMKMPEDLKTVKEVCLECGLRKDHPAHTIFEGLEYAARLIRDFAERRPDPGLVQARQFTGTNAEELADWCQGLTYTGTRHGHTRPPWQLHTCVTPPEVIPGGKGHADPGDWIVRLAAADADGCGLYEVLSAEEFGERYEPAGRNPVNVPISDIQRK